MTWRTVVLLLGLSWVQAARAQNLLTNGDFTADLSSWSQQGPFAPNTGSAGFDDDSGSAAAGGWRVQVADNANGGGGGIGLVQCVGGLPAPPWDFGARGVFADPDNCEHFVAAIFFDGPGCTGTSAGTTLATANGTVAGTLDGAATLFTRLDGTRLTDPLPGGNPTASVRMVVQLITGDGNDDCTAVYDSAYFGADGTTPVSLLEFAIE